MTEDVVNHPKHYGAHASGIECIDITRACTNDVGNCVKYVWREADKNGLEDLRKAEWYVKDHIKNFGTKLPPLPAHVTQKLKRVMWFEEGERFRFFRGLLEGNAHIMQSAISELIREQEQA